MGILYSNKFGIACNQETGEVVVTFMQNKPQMGDDGKIVGITSEEIVTIVLTLNSAEQLHGMIGQMIENN